MQYIKISKINCTCFYFLKWLLESKIIYAAPICDVHSLSIGLVILEIIVHDTLMCRSRTFPALCPFMPFQGQSKTILLALPIIPGEWWSHWPGISKQGQPTQGTFLTHLKEPSCGLSGQVEGQCWSEARPGQSVWSNLIRVLCSPPVEPREVCGCPRILGALPTVSWADHLWLP